MEGRPPETVVVGQVRVRRWDPSDVEDLHELILDNLDHLRPWMAWVPQEPLSLRERRRKMAGGHARWEDGEDFSYGIFAAPDGELLGACGLHRRGEADGLDIGYWVRGDRTGRGVATDAVRALVEAAFAIDGISHVEIHHDAANAASRRVPEKVGFRLVGERPDEVNAPAEVGTDVTWRLERSGS